MGHERHPPRRAIAHEELPSPTWASGAFELTGSDLRMKHAHLHSKELAHRGSVGCCHVTCHEWTPIGQASEYRPDIGQHDAIWLAKARYHSSIPGSPSHEAPRNLGLPHRGSFREDPSHERLSAVVRSRTDFLGLHHRGSFRAPFPHRGSFREDPSHECLSAVVRSRACPAVIRTHTGSTSPHRGHSRCRK